MGRLTPLQAERRKWVLKMRVWLSLCRNCGYFAPIYQYCQRCHDIKQEKQQSQRESLKVQGLCRQCMVSPVEGGQFYCQECKVKRFGVNECSADGCSNVVARNSCYCKGCQPVMRKCKNGLANNVYFPVCSVCDRLFTSRYRSAMYCDDDCKGAANYYGRATGCYDDVRVEWRDCKECGEPFKTYNINKQSAYCSERCSNRAGSRNGKHKRRLLIQAAYIEAVHLSVLFGRDGGRCKICDRKLNKTHIVPHKKAPTIDHIKPLSLGGEHSYKNTQLACFICNSLKGSSWTERGEGGDFSAIMR
jgi:5-methylcytosine-specific restriction endonuclease McrA